MGIGAQSALWALWAVIRVLRVIYPSNVIYGQLSFRATVAPKTLFIVAQSQDPIRIRHMAFSFVS
jgi:hypothetical protein